MFIFIKFLTFAKLKTKPFWGGFVCFLPFLTIKKPQFYTFQFCTFPFYGMLPFHYVIKKPQTLILLSLDYLSCTVLLYTSFDCFHQCSLTCLLKNALFKEVVARMSQANLYELLLYIMITDSDKQY